MLAVGCHCKGVDAWATSSPSVLGEVIIKKKLKHATSPQIMRPKPRQNESPHPCPPKIPFFLQTEQYCKQIINIKIINTLNNLLNKKPLLISHFFY